jgi:transcriptional regulator with GAF, ATPase, and Fis domain
MHVRALAQGGAGRGPSPERAPGGAPLPDQLLALASVGHELTSGATLAEGFTRAMDVLNERLGAKRAALFIADARHRTLTLEAAYGVDAQEFRPRFGQGVAGRVALVGRPIVVPAVRREAMALSELAEPARWLDHELSLVSVPITIRGRLAGALSVYLEFDQATGFATRLGLLQVVAAVIAQELRSGQLGEAGPPEDARPKPNEPAAFEYANMIGTSAAMRQVYEEVAQVARTMATALILGESGTGTRTPIAPSSRSSRSTARPSPKGCSSRSSSDTSAAPSPARSAARRGDSTSRRAARSSSTRSASCRSRPR